MHSKRVTVVGAANVDITATPLQPFVERDSNPSRVEIAYGGVGRNIAHNLALLGCHTRLLTVFGTDSLASALIDNCLSAGIHLTPVHHAQGARSNFFVCINDHYGEMQAGAADTALMDALSKELIDEELPRLNDMDAIVADCNVNADTLLHLFRHLNVPLYVDATSSPKSVRLKTLLNACSQCAAPLTVKVNRAEATALTGLNGAFPEQCAESLLAHGLRSVYVTLGAEGVCVADATHIATLPAEKGVNVVNTTGAGDAFLAAAVFAELKGATPQQAALTALKAAAITTQCAAAVNPQIATLNPLTP